MPLDRILGLGAVVLAVPVSLASWRFGLGTPVSPGPGFWPFLVATTILGLGAVLALRPDGGISVRRHAESRWTSLGIALATLAFFVLTLESLGYPLTMGFLLVAQFRWVEGRSWRIAILTAVATSGFSFGLFRFLLHVPLPAGIVPLPRGW
jgi:hypothetical protein